MLLFNEYILPCLIMETLFVFSNVQLQISLRIANFSLQMLLEIGLFKETKQKKKQKKKRKEKKRKESKLH